MGSRPRLAHRVTVATLPLGVGRRGEVEQRKSWKSVRIGGPLVLVAALAVGAFAAVGSCDGSNKMSGVIGGAGGSSGGPGPSGIAIPTGSSPDANLIQSAVKSLT